MIFHIKAIKCQPPSLKYPLQMTTYKQIFRYNESIEFHCAANYHIQGEAVRYCTQNDSFQQNLPTCSGMKILKVLNLYPCNDGFFPLFLLIRLFVPLGFFWREWGMGWGLSSMFFKLLYHSK